MNIEHGQIWKNQKGRHYIVIMLVNTESSVSDFVPSVVYQSIDNGNAWCSPISEWESNFKFVG